VSEPSTIDSLTLAAIAESAQSAARLAGLDDASAAQAALERAERRLALFAQGKPAHSRSVRLATEAVGRARRAVELLGTHTHTTREKRAQARAALRAAARAKA